MARDQQGHERDWIAIGLAVVGIVLGVVGTGAAVVAIQQADRANDLAAEANRLAESAQEARPAVAYDGMAADQDLLFRPPCYDPFLPPRGSWYLPFILGLQVTNQGGLPASVMEFVEYRGATPVDDQISVIFRVRHFLDETAYEQTEPVRDGRLPRDWSDDPAPVISLPTTVAPGQVVRVALDASQEIHFPGGMTPAVLGERLAGLSWSFPVTLDFAGGQQQTVRVEAVNPYQFGLPTGAFSADTLEKCQG